MWDIYNKLCTIFRDSPITIIIRNKIIVNYWSVSFCTIQVFIHLFPKKPSISQIFVNLRLIQKRQMFESFESCVCFCIEKMPFVQKKRWKNNEVRKTPFHAEIRYWTWRMINKVKWLFVEKSEHIAMRSMVCTMLCHRFEL